MAIIKPTIGQAGWDSSVDAVIDRVNALETIETQIAGKQAADPDLTTIAGLDATQAGALATDGAGWVRKTYAQLKTALGLVKADVGLGSVDNVSDANKPVSAAQQSALDGKVGTADARLTDTRIPTDASVTDAKVAADAAIAESKLNLATDAAPGTASRRTLGTGAQQAAPGTHNHDNTYVDFVNAQSIGGVKTFTTSGSPVIPAPIGAGNPVRNDDTRLAAIATKGPLPEATTTPRTAALGTPSGLLGYTNRYALTGAVTEALPAVTDGAVLAFAVTAGSTASLTLTRNGTDYFGDGTSASLVLAPGDYYFARGQVNGGQGRWRRVSAPLYSEQDAHNASLFSAVTVDGTFASTFNASTAALTKSDVGLGAVDNTADVNKPVSTATQAALSAVSQPPIAAGNYFFPNSSGATAAATLGTGNMRVVPWLVTRSMTIDRLGIGITVAGEAGSKYRPVVYADNGSCYPGALLLDAGQIAADATGVPFATVTLTLTPGLYWIGGVTQVVTTTQPTIGTISAWNPPVIIPTGTTAPTAGQTTYGIVYGGVTAAPPATFVAAQGLSGSAPRVVARAA